MDEITIDDKTYISSKRAAAITGYAKDYVGQLCREGRVEARLIGRSWYVFEDSIRKHRFEESETPVEDPTVEVETSEKTNNEAIWEEAVYTSEEVEMLPVIEEKVVAEEVKEEILEAEDAAEPEVAPETVVQESESQEIPIHVVEEVQEELPKEEVEEPRIEKESQQAWESWFTAAPTHIKVGQQPIKEVKEAYDEYVEPMQDIQPVRIHKSVAFDIGAPEAPLEEVVVREYVPNTTTKVRSNYLVIKAAAFATIVLFISLAVIGTGIAEEVGNNDSWGILNILGGASLIK